MSHRIHIFGASGSGTTTLGRHLADRLGARFLDTDSYYWEATDPPFTVKHPPERRIAMIEQDVADASHWVLSGSICSWGDPLLDRFTLAVFLQLEPTVRMARLQAREVERYGHRIEPDGDMHDVHRAFIEWAASYDTARAPIRSLALHEAWLQRLRCPVMRLDSALPVETLVDRIVARL